MEGASCLGYWECVCLPGLLRVMHVQVLLHHRWGFVCNTCVLWYFWQHKNKVNCSSLSADVTAKRKYKKLPWSLIFIKSHLSAFLKYLLITDNNFVPLTNGSHLETCTFPAFNSVLGSLFSAAFQPLWQFSGMVLRLGTEDPICCRLCVADH